MSKRLLAITTCRVSSVEQLENNSLNRQQAAVLRAAEELGVQIPEDGQWSGSVSSKAGTNVFRKDLKEMLEYCEKHKLVKYLIVDEVDRFMRSMKELFHFEVEFEKRGVKVWYANQPELNSDDHNAKLLKAFEVFKAEGSNVERQSKSISGQSAALKEGRYPFAPKPGYKKGYEKGIHEVDPLRGPALKIVLEKIATNLITPSQGLIELNRSDFIKDRARYKMDKFRKILIEPYYAGIVEVNKQVNVRNENGLHEPLITKEQHEQLVHIMDNKKKNQSGPRKNGNPEFPLSNLVSCRDCVDSSVGRLVGFKHSNGKNKANIYERYRCRGCGKYLKKDELHRDIEYQFASNPFSKEGLDALIAALDTVWKKKEGEAQNDLVRLKNKIGHIENSISNSVEAATDPSNASIKAEILESISKKKAYIEQLSHEIEELTVTAENDREQFLRFAFSFIDNMGSNFLNTTMVSPENRKRCKLLLFPAGFWVDENKKVYTPEISELYRLATKEKDTVVPDNSHLVRVRRL